MATVPTPEESAREILSIFVNQFKCRSGGVLRINSFNSVWSSRGNATEDFEPGMRHAAEKDWVEVQPGGHSYKLTDQGFAEA